MPNFFETPLASALGTVVGGVAATIGAGAGIDILEGVGVSVVDASHQLAQQQAAAQAAPTQAGTAAPAPTMGGIPRWVVLAGAVALVVGAILLARR